MLIFNKDKGEKITSDDDHGLGFSDRLLTLTPQFFENKAMSRLFREGAL